jgi:hypothetical protein
LSVRFEEAFAKLEENPFVGPIASESEDVGEEVRHIMFRTKAGRSFRALFVVVGTEVRILRVRGKGQPPLSGGELELYRDSMDEKARILELARET